MRKTRKPTPFLSISFAQVKYAYKKLRGEKMPENLPFQFAADAMFKEFGRDRILAALADYNADDYVNGRYDV